MEHSIETSIAVFFGLQGIPNALEDPQNPKVRYSEPQLRFSVLSERYCLSLPTLSKKLTFLYEFLIDCCSPLRHEVVVINNMWGAAGLNFEPFAIFIIC